MRHLYILYLLTLGAAACSVGRSTPPSTATAQETRHEGTDSLGRPDIPVNRPRPTTQPTAEPTVTPLPTPTTPTPTPTPEPPPTVEPTPDPTPTPITTYRYVGRYEDNPAGPIFSFCNSRIGATFTGTNSITVKLGDNGTDLWEVSIDDKRYLLTTSDSAARDYTIATDLSLGQHTIWMAKRTEFDQGGVGRTQFMGFTLGDGGTFLDAPKLRSRRMDFIGDSGFTGWGSNQLVTGNNDYCGFSPATQNALVSIPQFTADFLNAELHNLSWSGQAVYRSYYVDDGDPTHLFPAIFEQIRPPNVQPAWDFSKWTADVVVIQAGGDDVFGPARQGWFPDRAKFVDTYAAWLLRIRQLYPNTVIVATLTQAAGDADVPLLGNAILEAVTRRNQAGDPRVYYYSYFTDDAVNHTYDDLARSAKVYWGCGSHPSAAGARVLAQRLATFISSKVTGW